MMNMPAFIGSSQILNVSGSATVQFGDTAFISPKTSSKTTQGSGSATSGAFVTINSLNSVNTTLDSSVIDQPTLGNN
jgi:spore germination protein PF